jgi:hypothetical protein
MWEFVLGSAVMNDGSLRQSLDAEPKPEGNVSPSVIDMMAQVNDR